MKTRLNSIVSHLDVPRVDVGPDPDSEKRSRILEMLTEGKVSPEEAERLLDAVEFEVPSGRDGGSWPEDLPKYLYVRVEPKDGATDADQVKVTVSLALVKAGINFFTLLPKEAREDVQGAMSEKGVDFDLGKMSGAE